MPEQKERDLHEEAKDAAMKSAEWANRATKWTEGNGSQEGKAIMLSGAYTMGMLAGGLCAVTARLDKLERENAELREAVALETGPEEAGFFIVVYKDNGGSWWTTTGIPFKTRGEALANIATSYRGFETRVLAGEAE